ncbi:hypothetical protein II906_08695 [bacterium]|nr:hypothetical protein [bacterium]
MKKIFAYLTILAIIPFAFKEGYYQAENSTKDFIHLILKYEMPTKRLNNYISKANYKKSETISLEDFLYAKDAPENWKHLSLNDNGDVIYNGKVIVNDNFEPINNTTAYSSYLLLKIFMIADGAVPRENCDASDTATNGIYGLGCYVFENK